MTDELERIRDKKIEEAIAASKAKRALTPNYNSLLQNAHPERKVLQLPKVFTPRPDDLHMMVQLPPTPLNLRQVLLSSPTAHLYKLQELIAEILGERPDARA